MRTLKKINALIIVLIIALNTNAQYANYKFKEASLSIDFPKNPGTAQTIKDTKTKQVRKYVVKVKDADNEYRAEVEYYKEKNEKREIDNFFLAMFSKAQETSKVNFGGKSMTMAKGGTKKKKALLCVYYQGNKVYRLSIKSPSSYVSDEEAEKFFGSLNNGNSKLATTTASSTTTNKTSSTVTKNQSTTKKDNSLELYKQKMREKLNIVKSINRNLRNLGNYDYDFAKFAKDVKSLDYSGFLPEAKKHGNPDDVFYKQDFDAFMAFETSFPQLYETTVIPKINSQVKYAYSLYEKRAQYPNNLNTAINELEKLKPAVDGCKNAFPNDEAIKNGALDFYSAWKEIAGPVYEGTYLCDFHEQNGGKIFYSKEPIDPDNIDPTKFTTEFSMNDHIYAIAFLPKKMKLMGEPGKDDKGLFFKYFTNIDNNVSYTDYIQCYIDEKEYDKNKAYFLMDIMPDPAKASQWDAGMWMDKFAKLSPRKHKFNVSIYKYDPNTGWANGEFSIDLTGMDKAKMAADAKTAMTKVEDNIAKNQQLPDAFKKKSAVFRDPALSVNNIKAIVKREWGSYVAQVLKVAVVNDGKNNWEVAKDDLGYPENKQNSCAIYIAYKGTDGNCYFIDQSILFVKDYEGGGKYSSTIRLWGHYDLHKIVRIACENIK